MPESKLIHTEISGGIIGCFYDVYNELGFGSREQIYDRALEIQLVERGFVVDREYPVEVFFRGKQIGFHRCDMLVNNTVIVEMKATEYMTDVHKAQLRSYLAATNLELGMLLHFGPKAHYYRVLGPRSMKMR